MSPDFYFSTFHSEVTSATHTPRRKAFEKALRCFLSLRRPGRVFPADAGFRKRVRRERNRRKRAVPEPEPNPRPAPRIRPQIIPLFSDSFFQNRLPPKSRLSGIIQMLSYPVRQRKGGANMLSAVISFIVAVAGGATCHYIIKWLDSNDDDN